MLFLYLAMSRASSSSDLNTHTQPAQVLITEICGMISQEVHTATNRRSTASSLDHQQLRGIAGRRKLDVCSPAQLQRVEHQLTAILVQQNTYLLLAPYR